MGKRRTLTRVLIYTALTSPHMAIIMAATAVQNLAAHYRYELHERERKR